MATIRPLTYLLKCHALGIFFTACLKVLRLTQFKIQMAKFIYGHG